MTRRSWAWAVLAVPVALASSTGCGSSVDDRAAPSASSTPAATAAASEPTSPGSSASAPEERPSPGATGAGEVGLSADEARKAGVLFARYDARLSRSSFGDGRGRVRLENVGSDPDVYEIVLEPRGAGAVSVDTVSLAPGRHTWVDVRTHLDATTLVVVSRGRGHLPVAEVAFGDEVR